MRLTPSGNPVEQLATALVAGARAEAAALVTEATRKAGYEAMTQHLIQPAMYRVGDWWQEGRIGVAHEHLASAIVQRLLAEQVTKEEPATAPLGRKALIACVATNRHCLGTRIVADALELRGWEVHYLGADVPTEEIVAHAEHLRPEVLGLSASLQRQIPILREVTGRVREALANDPPRIVAGGLGVNRLHGTDKLPAVDGCFPHAGAMLEAIG